MPIPSTKTREFSATGKTPISRRFKVYIHYTVFDLSIMCASHSTRLCARLIRQACRVAWSAAATFHMVTVSRDSLVLVDGLIDDCTKATGHVAFNGIVFQLEYFEIHKLFQLAGNLSGQLVIKQPETLQVCQETELGRNRSGETGIGNGDTG